MSQRYQLADLLYLMARLRDPQGGCPWDLAQDFASIVPSTLEEAYEVADAIERADFEHLPEELGDLLFQVVFYAQLGGEQEAFDFASIVHGLTVKLIQRHPHVFAGGSLRGDPVAVAASSDDIKGQWEAIKQAERSAKGRQGLLDDVPVNLPSVSRAQKLQKRASRVGFDFATVQAAMEKVREEMAEVEQEVARLDGEAHAALGEELGDLLFSVVNVCRLGQFDAESLLRQTNRKFEQRFNRMHAQLLQQGLDLDQASLAQMEQAWQQIKKQPL